MNHSDPYHRHSNHLCADIQHVCRNLSLMLTAQRDQHSLTASLAEFLDTLRLSEKISIYQPLTHGGEVGERSLRLVDQAPGDTIRRAGDIPGMPACLEQGEPVEIEQQGTIHYLQPVSGSSTLALVIVFEGFRGDPVIRGFLADLADLVGNLNRLHAQSERDGLTNLYNRQMFDRKLARIQEELAHPLRRRGDSEPGHFLALIDVDHFKRINDTHGHIYGDEVLLELARMMERGFRHGDELFRYGGEEFAAILCHIDQSQVAVVLQRFRMRVMENLFPQIGGVTVSIGYCRLEAGPSAQMIERADKALYYCKNHGRNRISGYAQLLAEQKVQDIREGAGIELF